MLRTDYRHGEEEEEEVEEKDVDDVIGNSESEGNSWSVKITSRFTRSLYDSRTRLCPKRFKSRHAMIRGLIQVITGWE